MSLGITIENIIIRKTQEILNKNFLPDTVYVETDNLAEIIEKLVILHIRTWMLEDAIAEANSDEEIANLKRKIDICFKQKRPKLVQAINLLVDNAIIEGKSIREDSVKLYKGITE